MAIIELGERRFEFENRKAQSLLDAAEAAGVPVASSCRRGDCGQCVGVLAQGIVSPIVQAQPCVTDDNRVYLCNAEAKDNVTIRIPHFPELDAVPPTRCPAKIDSIAFRGGLVCELVLRVPPKTDFRFLPGQFVQVANKEGVSRSYSLAAPPMADKKLRIHIRKVEGGLFSDYLFNRAHVDDLLHLHGPMGSFIVREEPVTVKSTFFLATGTGIAPIRAMLLAATPGQRQRMGAVTVYWGNRVLGDAYLLEELTAMAATTGIRFVPVYSREVGSSFKHVQDAMLADVADLKESAVFACGNPAMIESARRLCLQHGLPPDRFWSDAFSAS